MRGVPGASAAVGRTACIAILTAGAMLAAGSVQARSVLELPYPQAFGRFEATTYDVTGAPRGTARFEIEELVDGRVRMTVRTGIDRGASNVASILLAPVEGSRRLRAIEQRSESHDAQGRSMGVLHVDHEAGVGSCTPAGGTAADSQRLSLPARERIANVALNLLFSPIALGEASRADFQVFVCRGGPRVIEFSAEPEAHIDATLDQRIVEIRYQPDLGPAIRWMAGSWLPQFSFWLDDEGNYLAHRIPLYTKGPEVLVIRHGISPRTLTAAP